MGGLKSKWADDDDLVEDAVKQDEIAQRKNKQKEADGLIVSQKGKPLTSKWATESDDDEEEEKQTQQQQEQQKEQTFDDVEEQPTHQMSEAAKMFASRLRIGDNKKNSKLHDQKKKKVEEEEWEDEIEEEIDDRPAMSEAGKSFAARLRMGKIRSESTTKNNKSNPKPYEQKRKPKKSSDNPTLNQPNITRDPIKPQTDKPREEFDFEKFQEKINKPGFNWADAADEDDDLW